MENEWTGARTGLLDQLASLCGARDAALLIDFRSLVVEPVPLDMGGWRFAVADSGERHSHASSGYNERREECARACELLGVASLRDVPPGRLAELPAPLAARARHVVEENGRVLAATRALRDGDMPALANLLSASHASLRDLYAVSTPAVEATVARLLARGRGGRAPDRGRLRRLGPRPAGAGHAAAAGAIVVAPGPGAHAEAC